MVDTVRTILFLTASEFQDGQPAGSITPQDMRDLIVSLSPPETTLVFNANLTWNLALDPIAQVTLTSNVTITITNGETGRVYRLAVIQGGTGNNTVTISGATSLGTAVFRTNVGSLNFINIDIVGGTRISMVV